MTAVSKGIIYTDKANCQDCYKCVRNCPVKSITIKDGQAMVEQEECVLCGTCIDICPTHSKKYRLDLQLFEKMLEEKDKPVYISLAPSFPVYFQNCTTSQLIQALHSIGVQGVSETALGAEIASYYTRKYFDSYPGGVLISSACPSVGIFLQKYYPQIYEKYYSEMPSPLGYHATYLRKLFGKSIRVVFVGPCIAKKYEADTFSDIDLALTFKELDEFLANKDVKPEKFNNEGEYCTEEAENARTFPVPGGMIKTVHPDAPLLGTRTFAFDGMNELKLFFDQFKGTYENLFLEVLACENGCINGPIMRHISNPAFNRLNFIQQLEISEQPEEKKYNLPLKVERKGKGLKKSLPGEKQIEDILEAMGKYTEEDMLNCNACGYFTCRDMAIAIYQEKAEINMCVSYMRKLAENKASALLKADPNGIVILNERLEIISYNPSFAAMFQISETMKPKKMQELMPDDDFFEVLTKNRNITNKTYHFPENDLTVKVSIFPIENYRLIGAIFNDISEEIQSKQEVENLSEITIANAHKVMNNQMKSAQQIAKMLGDVTADTKILLHDMIKLAEKFKQ